MTSNVDRLSASAKRVCDAQERVEKMRTRADGLRNKLDLQRQAIRTLNLLEDSLFEITRTHQLLEHLNTICQVTLP